MANTVSFIIRLQDKYSAAAAKISKATDKMNRKMGGLKKKVDQLQKGFTDFGKKAVKTGAIMTAALTLPIALLGRNMIRAASDAVETANKFNSVFDDVRGKANQVADSFSKSFGVAGSTARKLIGNTGDLLVGFGFLGDDALKLAKDVNELAADLASFQNIEGGAEAASVALTKALLGETESAKSLGIVIRQNTPEFRRNVAIIQRTQRVSVQQAKSIEILRIAQEQSRKAIGDVNRTWDDYASVVRRSDQANRELSEGFGTLLLPFATKFVNLLTRIIDKVNNLSPLMKKLILVFAGLLAIAGPLVIALGAIAFAAGAITLPILGIVAGVAAAVAAFVWLALNWDVLTAGFDAGIDAIGTKFTDLWAGVKSGFQSFLDFIQPAMDILLAPARAAAALGAAIGGRFSSPAAPSAPVGGGGSINGEITVSATQGAKVENTKLQSRGAGLNVGMNVAGAL